MVIKVSVVKVMSIGYDIMLGTSLIGKSVNFVAPAVVRLIVLDTHLHIIINSATRYHLLSESLEIYLPSGMLDKIRESRLPWYLRYETNFP